MRLSCASPEFHMRIRKRKPRIMLGVYQCREKNFEMLGKINIQEKIHYVPTEYSSKLSMGLRAPFNH